MASTSTRRRRKSSAWATIRSTAGTARATSQSIFGWLCPEGEYTIAVTLNGAGESVATVKASRLDLAPFIAEELPEFVPDHPAPFFEFSIPASPFGSTRQPAGS